MKDSCLALRWGLAALLLSLSTFAVCRGQSYVRIESEAESQARERIESALAGIGSLDCVDKPLHELADELSRRMGVSIVLAKNALEESAISLESPVTARITGVSYRSLLRLVLTDLKLTWTFRNEVILITTPEDAEAMLETRLYPVLDLVAVTGGTPDKAMREVHDYDTLIDTLTTTVEPDSWDEVGGPGTIAEFPGAGALVISQTTEIHEQVEKVLAALRRVKQIQGIPALATLPAAPARRIRDFRRLEADPRPHTSAPAQAWQLPRVHGDE
jgi:hypothetical protein